MKNAAAIAAQLVDVRNVGQHKCVKLTLHVPAEQAELVMAAFGWPTAVDPVPVAVARLAQPASVKPPMRAPQNKMVRLAGMLGKEPLFHRYIDVQSEKDASDFIRTYCNVTSRTEIISGTSAEQKFLQLYDKFVLWRDADVFVEPAQGAATAAPQVP